MFWLLDIKLLLVMSLCVASSASNIQVIATNTSLQSIIQSNFHPDIAWVVDNDGLSDDVSDYKLIKQDQLDNTFMYSTKSLKPLVDTSFSVENGTVSRFEIVQTNQVLCISLLAAWNESADSSQCKVSDLKLFFSATDSTSTDEATKSRKLPNTFSLSLGSKSIDVYSAQSNSMYSATVSSFGTNLKICLDSNVDCTTPSPRQTNKNKDSFGTSNTTLAPEIPASKTSTTSLLIAILAGLGFVVSCIVLVWVIRRRRGPAVIYKENELKGYFLPLAATGVPVF